VDTATRNHPDTDTPRATKLPTSTEDGVQHDHQQLLSLLAFEEGDTVLRSSDLSGGDTSIRSHGSRPIRSVLIVDQNQWILDLFVRSVQTMLNGDGNADSCNTAVVECAPNVPVAMSIIKNAIASRRRDPPFDLIIAEQQIPTPPTQKLQQPFTNSDSVIDDETGGESDTTISKDPTNIALLAGAELLFHNLAPEYRDQMLLISVAPSPFSKSSHQNANISELNANSAVSASTNTVTTLSDLVWSKPPPRMDNNLNRLLIRTLQHKREHGAGRTNSSQRHP
jgi:hypothetical protein